MISKVLERWQLYSFQHGLREVVWSELMKEAVAKLPIEDVVAIAAYAGIAEAVGPQNARRQLVYPSPG